MWLKGDSMVTGLEVVWRCRSSFDEFRIDALLICGCASIKVFVPATDDGERLNHSTYLFLSILLLSVG